MKRVLVITNNLQQASFRLRVAELVEPLAARGCQLQLRVRPRGLWARRRLLREARQFDAVLLQRKLLDPADARLLRRNARRLFFDVDDAIMYHAHPVGWWSRWRTKRRFRATASVLDHVVAGNEYLAAIFQEQGCQTSVLPTVVDPAHYLVKQHAATATPRLVWIGSRSTLPLLEAFLPAIERACREVPGLRLRVIADAACRSSIVPIDHVPWAVDTEAASLCQGDIGIAPTPSDAWTQGKCGFKILQYMAAGLPVIASPVGANAEIVLDGRTGLLPRQVDDWPAALVRLAQEAPLRAAMGAAGRARVEQEYGLARAVDHWVRLLMGERAAGQG